MAAQLEGVCDEDDAMIFDSECHELLQIEQAAHGMVSGTLAEWPHLKSALRKRGIDLPNHTSADELKGICKAYFERGQDEQD